MPLFDSIKKMDRLTPKEMENLKKTNCIKILNKLIQLWAAGQAWETRVPPCWNTCCYPAGSGGIEGGILGRAPFLLVRPPVAEWGTAAATGRPEGLGLGLGIPFHWPKQAHGQAPNQGVGISLPKMRPWQGCEYRRDEELGVVIQSPAPGSAQKYLSS